MASHPPASPDRQSGPAPEAPTGPDALSGFSPATRDWFCGAFAAPTPVTVFVEVAGPNEARPLRAGADVRWHARPDDQHVKTGDPLKVARVGNDPPETVGDRRWRRLVREQIPLPGGQSDGHEDEQDTDRDARERVRHCRSGRLVQDQTDGC